MDILTEEIIRNLPTVNYKQKVQLLTLKPTSWKIKKTLKYFEVSRYLSRYLVWKSNELMSRKSILTLTDQKTWKVVSNPTVEIVESFFS